MSAYLDPQLLRYAQELVEHDQEGQDNPSPVRADENMSYMNSAGYKGSHSRGLEIGFIDIPFHTADLPFLVFDKLSRFLRLLRGLTIFSIFERLARLHFGLDGLCLFVCFNGLIVSDLVQHTARTKLFDGPLSVDAPVEHPNDVVRPREHQFYVMGYENLF